MVPLQADTRTPVLRALRGTERAPQILLGHGWQRGACRPPVAGLESLTAAMRTLGVLTVRVLRSAPVRVRADEARAIGVAAGSRVWCREILLLVDGQALIAARSVLPLAAARQAWRAVRGLGRRPLGSLLYADPAVRRSVLVFRRRHAQLLGGARHVERAANAAGPARRSLFLRRGLPLLVAECFLPAFFVRAAGLSDAQLQRGARAPRPRAGWQRPDGGGR